MTQIGVQVLEGVSSGTTAVVEASKHNIGLISERERGIPNKPVLVSSLQEDRKLFGGPTSTTYGAYASRHIFNNVGVYGAKVYVCRIVDPSSVVAEGTLTDGAPSNQDLIITTPTPFGVSTKEVAHVTPINPSVGDTFSITRSANTLTYTCTVATVANVVAGLQALIVASVNAAWTAVTAVDMGTYVQITHNTVNTALGLTKATTSDSSPNDILTLFAGQQGQKDPGTWGNDLVVKVFPKDDDLGLAGKYLAEVYYKGYLKESFSGATWDKLIQEINNLSYYIFAAPVDSNQEIYTIQTISLSRGTYVAPIESDFYPVPDLTAPEGLACFDGFDVQLISCTEHQALTMTSQGRDYCESRNDCMYIANLPYMPNEAAIQSFATQLQNELTSQCALYNCWVKTSDEQGGFVTVPAIGCILGAGYVRTPSMQRDQIWTPPAGIDSVFKDVVAIYPENVAQSTIDTWVKRYSVNPVIFRKGKGFYIASSRTVSTNSLYVSIHIRRMTNFLVKTLNDSFQFAAQRSLTPTLRRQMIVTATAYFRSIYNDGGLEKSVPFEDAFKAISDSTNNPVTQPRSQLNIDLDWIPTECAESIQIRLNRNDGALIAQVLDQANSN